MSWNLHPSSTEAEIFQPVARRWQKHPSLWTGTWNPASHSGAFHFPWSFSSFIMPNASNLLPPNMRLLLEIGWAWVWGGCHSPAAWPALSSPLREGSSFYSEHCRLRSSCTAQVHCRQTDGPYPQPIFLCSPDAQRSESLPCPVGKWVAVLESAQGSSAVNDCVNNRGAALLFGFKEKQPVEQRGFS